MQCRIIHFYRKSQFSRLAKLFSHDIHDLGQRAEISELCIILTTKTSRFTVMLGKRRPDHGFGKLPRKAVSGDPTPPPHHRPINLHRPEVQAGGRHNGRHVGKRCSEGKTGTLSSSLQDDHASRHRPTNNMYFLVWAINILCSLYFRPSPFQHGQPGFKIF